MNTFQKLDWDSHFFGYDVARINLDHLTSSELSSLLTEMKLQNIKLVYGFADPQNSEANKTALENDGICIDTKVIYTCSLLDITIQGNSSNIVSYLGHELTDQLKSLSLQSGEYSRFKRDTHFKNNEYEKLYIEWIRKSLTTAKDVLVYKEHEKELGVIVLDEKEGKYDIILLAVDKESRGKSIGKQLMFATLDKAKKEGFEEIQVTTQKANTIACSFYEKLGFSVTIMTNIYHFWL